MNRSPRKSRGAAAVELAFISIPLVLMAVAAIDFARAIFVYDQLAKAARDGARYLSFFDPTDPDPENYPIGLAKSRMLYGSVSGNRTIVPGLTAAMISICDSKESSGCPGERFANIDTGNGTINLVKVTISGYTFTPIFPGVSQLTTITFSPISVTMRQLFP